MNSNQTNSYQNVQREREQMNRDPERSVEKSNPEFKTCFYDFQAVGPRAQTVNVGFFSIMCIMLSESKHLWHSCYVELYTG